MSYVKCIQSYNSHHTKNIEDFHPTKKFSVSLCSQIQALLILSPWRSVTTNINYLGSLTIYRYHLALFMLPCENWG